MSKQVIIYFRYFLLVTYGKKQNTLDSHEGNPLTHTVEHLGKTLTFGIVYPGFQWYLKISFCPSGICFLFTGKVGAEPSEPCMMYDQHIVKVLGELPRPISKKPNPISSNEPLLVKLKPCLHGDEEIISTFNVQTLIYRTNYLMILLE